jgi:hypothetical protein
LITMNLCLAQGKRIYSLLLKVCKAMFSICGLMPFIAVRAAHPR